MTDEPLPAPTGYRCTCGKWWHGYSPYVKTHWDERVEHTCDCGRVNVIQRGAVVETLDKKPDKEGDKL